MATSTDVAPQELLKIVADQGNLDSYKYSQESGKDHQAIVGVIKSLASLGDVSQGQLGDHVLGSPLHISVAALGCSCGARPE